MRHCWLMRILCCPALFPESASSRLAGGMRRSLRSRALLSMASLLSARCWMFPGKRRERCCFQIFSVSVSPKLLITENNNPVFPFCVNVLFTQNRNIHQNSLFKPAKIPERRLHFVPLPHIQSHLKNFLNIDSRHFSYPLPLNILHTHTVPLIT